LGKGEAEAGDGKRGGVYPKGSSCVIRFAVTVRGHLLGDGSRTTPPTEVGVNPRKKRKGEP